MSGSVSPSWKASPEPADPGRALAVAFRALMLAMARPGSLRRAPDLAAVSDEGARRSGLSQAAHAVARTLCDPAAPLWLAPRLAADAALQRRLRFDIGAALAESPGDAAFLVGAWEEIAAILYEARRGRPERPDLSATLIVEVELLSETPQPGALGVRLDGPGVCPEEERRIWLSGVDSRFLLFLEANAASYPLGFDLFATFGDRLCALPRSVRARPI